MSRNEAIIRETKRRTLSFMHNAAYKAESYRLNAILREYDPSVCIQKKPQKVRTVTFIITRMVRFHGGQTSILHLGTELEKMGLKVCYLSCKEQSPEEMELCANANLPGYRGRVFAINRYLAAIKKGKIKEPDVVVASSWDTVSFALKFGESYKMYFVQDYEPLFYKFGEEYLMCRNTYLQGLHMVSLGEWNRRMILKELGIFENFKGSDKRDSGIKIDVVSFPYDSEGYMRLERNYDAYHYKNKITIAVYLKFYGKRLPNLIPYMLENTAEKLKENGIELEILYFGEAKTFNPKGGKNLGQLNKEELRKLYAKADFGLVASMSNISLVPYEMHASGLPVIEFGDGSYPFFFGNDTAILTKIGEKDIAGKLLEAIKDPQKLREMDEKAGEKLKSLSWERTAKEFMGILKSITGTVL
ncbi:MAG: glycosyltransferase family 4 protein [Lachnospiraceae bacterium]|nr:glycosyltransferase family 4 protein [Lachnospiraceae bacterium]